MKKKSLAVILILTAILNMFVLTGCSKTESKTNFSSDVQNALDAFIEKNKNTDSAYVVFDFDNTTSIFDIEEQLAIYQLSHMAFEITPKNMADVLSTGLNDLDKDLSSLGYGNGSYNDWISDITSSYEKLVNSYGQFSAKGLSEEESNKIEQDDDWKEFSVKMRTLYDVVYDNESASVAYPWITYWFTGMTEDEIYNLATNSHKYYSEKETSKQTWSSPKNYASKVGYVEYTWTSGVSVTEDVKDLMKNLSTNGIDVWICSASYIDVVRAAVDFWGLNDYITGILAMQNTIVDGKMINQYDYEKGPQTQGEGKVIAIENTLCKKYGKGPLAGFMDSTCDFNFCTEFDSLQLVVCFNRANRKVTDGGGLIAIIAMYQKNNLGYDFAKANSNGDTLYVLQGRDENKLRSLRSINSTIRLGDFQEKLFANEDNEKVLNYIIEHKLSTKQALETFALKTSSNSELGIKYGFLTEYRGYHSIKY